METRGGGGRAVVLGMALTLVGLAGWALFLRVPFLRLTALTAWIGCGAGTFLTVRALLAGARPWVRVLGILQILLAAFFVAWFLWLSVLPGAAAFQHLPRAPDFTLPDQDGRKVSLSEELAKGPVLLVFFRGPW